MDKNHANHNIRCTINECANHCSGEACCALDSIEICCSGTDHAGQQRVHRVRLLPRKERLLIYFFLRQYSILAKPTT